MGVEFHSREFAGLRIAKDSQNYGTLSTLKHGLLLDAIEEDANLRKIVLMPHGKKVACSKRENPRNVRRRERRNELRIREREQLKKFGVPEPVRDKEGDDEGVGDGDSSEKKDEGEGEDEDDNDDKADDEDSDDHEEEE